MSDLNYIHGAAAQEHISNSIHADQTDQLVTRANRAIDAANGRAEALDAENRQLRDQLQSMRTIQKRVDDSRVAETIIKDAGRDQLANEMQMEARSAHDFVLAWIDHYGGERSQEFVEGIKEGMKLNMPFSTSESMRKRFIKGFEERANQLYRDKGENALTIVAFNAISSEVAVALITELQAKMRADLTAENGVNYMKPSPGRNGPAELRERHGDGNFKAQDFITKD